MKMETGDAEILEETQKKYHPDFDSADGDIILSSNEGTQFRVSSCILKMASPFFRSTLSLPQGCTATQSTDVITLDESTRVVETLLRIVCCKGVDPEDAFPSIDNVRTLIFAAEKYEFPGALSYLRAVLMYPRFLEKPLDVYALSVRYGWAAEAKHSSRLTLALDVFEQEHREIINSLSGSALMALLDLRWKRKVQFRAALDEPSSFSVNDEPSCCASCGTRVDVHIWRELKWRVLDEMDKHPSSETVKLSFFTDPYTWRCFELQCSRCNHNLFNRKDIEKISELIDDLPSSI